MKTLEVVYRHPLRADGVTLAVFKSEAGYLVIESRDGAATVSATLGLFDDPDAALARADSRSRELLRQGYRQTPAPETGPSRRPGGS